MIQVANLLRQHEDACVACFAVDACSDDIKNSYTPKLNSMDEEPSRTVAQEEEEEEEEEEEGVGKEEQDAPSSSSRDWVQLGLGTSSSAPGGRRQALTELELFRDRPSSSLSPQPQTPWGSWDPTEMIGGSLSMRAPTMPEFAAAQFARPPGSSGASVAAEFRTGIRVVSPPRRQTGVWFILQAAQNQGRQPFLPQIPKNSLRIKDGRMTVRLLMKYLANKLALEDESELLLAIEEHAQPTT